MTATLFISDLHLEVGRPDITAQFYRFLEDQARGARALYILGDLFEAWVGDDDEQPLNAEVASRLQQLAASGVDCFFVHGNRDFLVGRAFADRAGLTLLDEWTVLDLAGERVLVTHGDALCTDDTEYMNFRAMVRNPEWQAGFLALPLDNRYQMAAEARRQSRTGTAAKSEEIMDVNETAVHRALRDHGVQTLLHGHTHRPNVHEFSLDNRPATRIVLGDWYQQGSMVRWDDEGFELISLPRE